MQGLQGCDRSTPGTHLVVETRCNSHRLLDRESAIGRLLKSRGKKADLATSPAAKAYPRAAAACMARAPRRSLANHQCFRDSVQQHYAPMASQPPNKPKASRWGSLLSAATATVAGLESGLDKILAENNDASARSRAQDEAAANEKPAGEPPALVIPSAPSELPRSSSRSRVNDRLQAKLAKAAASRNPSRSSTPLNQPASPRSSLDSRQSADISRSQTESKHDLPSTPKMDDSVPDVSTPTNDPPIETIPQSSSMKSAPDLVVTEPPPTLLTSGLPINPARVSKDSEDRPEIDADIEAEAEAEAEESTGRPEGKLEVTVLKDTTDPDAALIESSQDEEQVEKQRLEEYIDKLEAKLGYFAKETAAAAERAASSSQAASHERRLAEKDTLIATLTREGIELSKTEGRQRSAIKERVAAIQKMRVQTQQDEKAMAELRKRLARLEDSESDMKQRLRRAEQVEKQNAEHLKRLSNMEKDVESHKSDLASNKATIAALRSQLLEAEKKAEEADVSVAQADTKKLSAVQEQLEDARLEQRLAEDRWNTEVKRVNEEARQQKQQASFRETELTNEISVSLCFCGKQFIRAILMCKYRITKVVSKHSVYVQRKHPQMWEETHKPNCFARSKHCKLNTLWQRRIGEPSKLP
jgi:hypothetical protein